MLTPEERIAHLEGKIDLILESTRNNEKMLEGNGRPGILEVAAKNQQKITDLALLSAKNATAISSLATTVDKHISSGRHVPGFFLSWEFVGILGTTMLVAWPILYLIFVAFIGLEHWGDLLLHALGLS